MNRQDHLLVILAEEAAEVAQAVAKALRFGLDDGYPGTDRQNAEDIAHEIDDLLGVVGMLREEGMIPPSDLDRVVAKRAKIESWFRYSKERGRLS